MSKSYRRGRPATGINKPHGRRLAAEARNQSWAELPPESQLQILDARLGPGVGAKKQRAKILAKINLAKKEAAS